VADTASAKHAGTVRIPAHPLMFPHHFSGHPVRAWLSQTKNGCGFMRLKRRLSTTRCRIIREAHNGLP
jgi:hypothetical protein